MTHLVIVGDSDAGISAALRARELDAGATITVIVADAFPNYSICGLPFYLSGETPEWQMLAHRTQEELEATRMHLRLNQTVESIDPVGHTVVVHPSDGLRETLPHDRLILATGAVSRRLFLVGLDLPGVFLLHTMADSFALQQFLETRAPRSALIVGGGYIGLEMADALTLHGLQCTCNCFFPLPENYPDLSRVIETCAFFSLFIWQISPFYQFVLFCILCQLRPSTHLAFPP